MAHGFQELRQQLVLAEQSDGVEDKEEPRAGSYEASLTEEQRTSLHALLLSGLTLAEVQEKVPPWPDGPEKGRKPSTTSLWRTQVRLRVQEKVRKIEMARVTCRATQSLLQKLVNQTDQEQVLDQALTLIGQQVIDAALDGHGPTCQTAAAWLLLRRADQRRFDRRTALFQPQAGQAREAG